MFTMKLNWGVPKKHVRLLRLLGHEDIVFHGNFLYTAGESIQVDAAIACCIKNYLADAHPEHVFFHPTENYAVEISGDEILKYSGQELKELVFEKWFSDRYDRDKALLLLAGELTITDFLR